MSLKNRFLAINLKSKLLKLKTSSYVIFLLLMVLFATLCMWLTSCSSINKMFGLKDDNVAEELIEQAIESKTGLNIDLTPSSPE